MRELGPGGTSTCARRRRAVSNVGEDDLVLLIVGGKGGTWGATARWSIRPTSSAGPVRRRLVLSGDRRRRGRTRGERAEAELDLLLGDLATWVDVDTPGGISTRSTAWLACSRSSRSATGSIPSW